jgi:hypothetical protein
MRFSEATDLIYAALTDPSPSVRQTACNGIQVTRSWQSIAANEPAERQIELDRNKTISGALASIVRNDTSSVARSAAAALGVMGEFRAIGAILGRLGRVVDDRFLEHALIYALIEINDYETTKNALSSENPRVIKGTLIALSEMSESKLEALEVLPFLAHPNDALRKAVHQICVKNHKWDAALANRFVRWNGDFNENRLETLFDIVPLFLDSLSKFRLPLLLSASSNSSHSTSDDNCSGTNWFSELNILCRQSKLVWMLIPISFAIFFIGMPLSMQRR